jgi:hypothetical protein
VRVERGTDASSVSATKDSVLLVLAVRLPQTGVQSSSTLVSRAGVTDGVTYDGGIQEDKN